MRKGAGGPKDPTVRGAGTREPRRRGAICVVHGYLSSAVQKIDEFPTDAVLGQV